MSSASRSGRPFDIVRRGETNVIRVFFNPIDASNCAYGYVATARQVEMMLDQQRKRSRKKIAGQKAPGDSQTPAAD